MSHVAALRKDMVILEKSELSDLRNENEKLKLLLQQTKSQVSKTSLLYSTLNEKSCGMDLL